MIIESECNRLHAAIINNALQLYFIFILVLVLLDTSVAQVWARPGLEAQIGSIIRIQDLQYENGHKNKTVSNSYKKSRSISVTFNVTFDAIASQ